MIMGLRISVNDLGRRDAWLAGVSAGWFTATVMRYRSPWALAWGIHADVRDLVLGGVVELESAPDLGEYGLFQDRIGSQEGAPSR